MTLNYSHWIKGWKLANNDTDKIQFWVVFLTMKWFLVYMTNVKAGSPIQIKPGFWAMQELHPLTLLPDSSYIPSVHWHCLHGSPKGIAQTRGRHIEATTHWTSWKKPQNWSLDEWGLEVPLWPSTRAMFPSKNSFPNTRASLLPKHTGVLFFGISGLTFYPKSSLCPLLPDKHSASIQSLAGPVTTNRHWLPVRNYRHCPSTALSWMCVACRHMPWMWLHNNRRSPPGRHPPWWASKCYFCFGRLPVYPQHSEDPS